MTGLLPSGTRVSFLVYEARGFPVLDERLYQQRIRVTGHVVSHNYLNGVAVYMCKIDPEHHNLVWSTTQHDVCPKRDRVKILDTTC
jgi:hypothetical protein